MSPTRATEAAPLLNIGCGDHPLPGFVNIDQDPGADVQADVTRGLPYPSRSVAGIFSEHFIEHLTQAQGAAFFRECRRVLVDGGRVRVATPDLDFLVDVFATDWRRNMAEWSRYGYEWIANRAEQLNLVMREWGHRWLYNQEELVRLATLAGLEPLERCRLGESSEPRLRGVDYREGSTLIYEFVKRRPAERAVGPLVSIVITAYNPRYFEDALESALNQSYRDLEIVIGDDRPSGEIAAIVARHPDARIRHHQNPRNLGEKQNLIECFARARGEYIKFLNDDDLLHPECVARMARCLDRHPDVTLVTSHRQCIDAEGRTLPEIAATRRPVKADSIIDGVSLARALLESGVNFVGEPSTVLFRKSDLAGARPNILSFGDRECIGTVDVTMWASLLSRGDAIYLVDTLSSFRLHPEQAQRSTDYLQRQAGPAREQILFDARRMGLLDRTGPLTLSTRPLSGSPGGTRDGDAAVAPKERGAPAPRRHAKPAHPPRTDVAAPRVSIIIPVLNRIELTLKCLEAIEQNTPAGACEIVIVDNGSTDGTSAELEARRDGTTCVISNRSNLGFATACNQGARAAAGEYLMFLNNDTEPEAGWLEPLIEVLDADPTVGAVGSKLLFPDGTIQHAGVLIVEDRSAASALVARHVHYRKPGGASEAGRMTTYQALTAACLMIRRTAFTDAEGFDEGYWNGYEDVDLCFKLGRRSWKLVYQPQSVVTHHESQSGPDRYRKVAENVARLQERWRGTIAPDVVRDERGALRRTGAGYVRPYALPDPPRRGDAGVAPAEPSTARITPASDTTAADLVSIVILTCNQLRYTQECVASIRRHTPEPHEIVFVDNGSTDGTVAWLERQAREHPGARVIRNPTNLGFAKGCNQGIAAAQGAYLLLLNNDVVVTPGWLSGMLECLRAEPDAGLVGPMTNRISGPQQLPAVPYASTTAGLDEFATAFRERNRGRRVPMRRVVGFCMLFRRALVDSVGVLDERFGSGNFEDDDLCLRAALLGMKSLVAGDVFVHHYGSRTFVGNRVDFAGAMTGNRREFAAKWGAIAADTPLGKKLQAVQAAERAAEQYAHGETAKAIETVVRGLERSPAEGVLHDALVRILMDSHHFKQALDVLRDAPAAADDTATQIRIGYCQEGLELTDEADACAERVLARDPRSAPALNLKGVVAYQRGDREAAARWCRQALESDPGFGAALRNLGVLEWSSGRHVEGLELLERSFVLAPGSADSIAAYHSAVTEESAWGRAAPVLAEARALLPRNKRIAFFLIESLIHQGEHAAAMDLIEDAMRRFGIDDGFLAAALDVRRRVGPLERGPIRSTRGRISLCMIVRDEERDLARCLASVKPVVSEMIVVDTGSTDRTREIATAFGAKVFEHAWTGDFSAARNYSLALATGDMILVLDADETIAARDHDALVGLAAQGTRKPRAWSFVTRNYVVPVTTAGWTANQGSYPDEEAGTGWIPSVKVRLFPRLDAIRFSAPVHEVVEPSLTALRIPAASAPIPVHHFGKLDRRDAQEKGEAYYALGKQKLEELGDDPIAISELAIQAGLLGRHDEAVELWQRVLTLRPDLSLAWFNLGSALLQLRRYGEALAACRRAMELDPDQKEIAYNGALSELHAGDVERAVTIMTSLAEREPDYPVATALLAAALCCAGGAGQAAARFATLVERGFALADYLAALAEGLVAAGRDEQALAVIAAARDAGVPVAAPLVPSRT